MPLTGDASVGGIFVDEPWGDRCFYQSVIYKPGECEISLEEARWNHYLDTGLVPPPKTSANTAGPDVPAEGDGESATSTGPPQDAGTATTSGPVPQLNIDDQSSHSKVPVSLPDLDDGSENGSVVPSVSRRQYPRRAGNERERRSKSDRRLRRVEKTVEALSHGLILALTQLKSESGGQSGTGHTRAKSHRGTHPGFNPLRKAVSASDDATGALLTALSGMTLSDHTRARVSDLVPLRSDTVSYSREGDNNLFGCVATGNDKSLFTSKDRSPISGMLSPILNFITSPDVLPFLEQAAIYNGLRNTQIFDLFWVLNNLFNIHGGILIHCLQKGLYAMGDISQSLGLNEWSRDPVLCRELDEAYLKELRPHIQTDGDHDGVSSAAWKSYCLELAVIFSEHFPEWRSVRFFRDLSENYRGCFNPVITTSYIEDLTTLWAKVHPALLEVTRWFEPFIDYGPDFNRETPFYDATIALGCRVRELLSGKGAKEPEASRTADNLLNFLRENRSQALAKMQAEMESVMSTVSRDFVAPDGPNKSPTEPDPPSVEELALVGRADRVTGWRLEKGAGPDRLALMLHEVAVTRGYRPRLLRAGTAAASVRTGIFCVLARTEGLGRGTPLNEEDVFWDGIV